MPGSMGWLDYARLGPTPAEAKLAAENAELRQRLELYRGWWLELCEELERLKGETTIGGT